MVTTSPASAQTGMPPIYGNTGNTPAASTSTEPAAAQTANTIPYSPEANNLKSQYEKAFQTATNKLPNQVKNTYANEGFNVDVSMDANGNPSLSHIGANANNPYSTFFQNRKGNAQSFENLDEQHAANNLQGGLANQGMDPLRQAAGIQDAQQITRLEGAKNAALQAYQDQQASYRQNLALLDLSESRANIAAQNFTPVGSGEGGGPGGDGGPDGSTDPVDKGTDSTTQPVSTAEKVQAALVAAQKNNPGMINGLNNMINNKMTQVAPMALMNGLMPPKNPVPTPKKASPAPVTQFNPIPAPIPQVSPMALMNGLMTPPKPVPTPKKAAVTKGGK